ncbi:Uncharacterised protein [Pseudomonas aeruginosa]|nr:Uncharacterised protein [Pseudomonas aeruginosa]
MADDLVAEGVPIAVVDVLEVIQVDHQQAQRLRLASDARELHEHQLVELATIEQAGQGVVTGQVLQLAILLLQLLPLQLQLALLAQVAHVAVPEDQRQQQAEAERGEAVGLVRQAQLRVGLGVVHRHLEGQHRQTVEGHRVGRADQDEHGAGETGQQQRRDVAGDALVDAGDGDAEAYDPCAAQQDQQAHAPQLGRLAAQP